MIVYPADRAQSQDDGTSDPNLNIQPDIISSGTIVTVPAIGETVPWTISAPAGMVTTYVITSCTPFTETVKCLAELKQPIGDVRAMLPLAQPLVVAQAILQDLHNASQSLVERLALEPPNDRYTLAMGCWGTFKFTYDVTTPTA